MGSLCFPWIFLITTLSVFFGIDNVCGQCLENQRSALVQWKQSLIINPRFSSKLVLWNSSIDCCSWAGISCTDGRVTAINLSDELISGGLNDSSTLFDLQHLRRLNLANNNFSTSISSGFGKLVSLIELNLSTSGFYGQIPLGISCLTRLVTLDFSSMYFPGIKSLKLENPNLIMLVQNLTELTELHLDGVNISSQGKEWCQALSSSLLNLRVLSLSSCYLSGPIDSSLLKLQFLSVIRLDRNNLSAPVPEFFANFSNLTSLRLGNCGLYGTFSGKIFQVPTLQYLDISSNILLQGSLPDFLLKGVLQTLLLSDTQFSGKLPDSIGNLKMLSRLELSGCNFSGPIPNSFASLTQLIYLDLSSNMFTGPIPSFRRLKNLMVINLAHNDLTGPVPSTYFEGLTRLESVNLRNNSLNGGIPSSLFGNPFLLKLQLSFNQFSGQLDEFPSPSSSLLQILDLSSNDLEGRVPMSVFELRSLKILELSSNNFNGTIKLRTIQKLRNLTTLALSDNKLSIDASGGNSTLPSFPPLIGMLKLASCNIGVFPNLRNYSSLGYLDLSDNQIQGKIPNWIWNIGNGSLTHLNLSCNFLLDLEQPFSDQLFYISILDLHSNMLQGPIPILAPYATYLDYSTNNLTGVIPADIGNYLNLTIFFSISDNKLNGNIPESICNASYLQVLDLSNNALSGLIPPCLVYNNMTSTLKILNLAKNNLHGSIPETFSSKCGLRTLDLSVNMFEGQVPRALASCTMLEILNLGNNRINDNFPCWLKKLSNLRVLVLRFNRFQGRIKCPDTSLSWPLLQILDLAANNLSGNLPPEYFLSWKAMMVDEDGAQPKLSYLRYEVLKLSNLHYQDTVMVTSKGLQLELVKILSIFTSIDLSRNMFHGQIPEEVGHLKSLHLLNISHNALTGQLPSSMGNMKQLESLDLSQNQLNGVIPVQLAGLTFLSLLNLSFNQLEGMIPKGSQLQTFSEDLFQGNEGLCGAPLKARCTDDGVGGSGSSPPTFEDRHSESGSEINWKFISSEIGFVFGLGVVIGPLVFWKRWRTWYYGHVDRIVLKILCSRERKRGRRARR